jgi:hypothetical protein
VKYTNSGELRGELFECGESELIYFKPEVHGRHPFLNPLCRGQTRVFARPDSGFPSLSTLGFQTVLREESFRI